MAVNKVNYGNTTLIDLTDTTATASDVAQGKYFYTNAGVRTEGTSTGGGAGAFVDTVEQLVGGGDHHIITGVDISSDTVTAEHLEQGYTAHDSSGNAVVGTLVAGGGGGIDDPIDFTGGNILAIKGHGTEYIITDIYPNFVGVYGTKLSDDSITNYEYYWAALGLSTTYLGLQRNGTAQTVLVKGMGGNAPAVTYTGFANGNIITPVFSSMGLSEPANKQQPLAFGRGYYNGSMESQIATYTFYGLNILNSNFEYTYRFVPWLDNGVACIKELISGTIYHNSGTGAYDYIDLEGVLHNV